MKGDGGRRTPRSFEQLEIEAGLHDVLGKGLVEVLERRDPKGIAVLCPDAHMPGRLAVATFAVEDPAGRGDLDPNVAVVHDANPLAHRPEVVGWTIDETVTKNASSAARHPA